MPRHFDTTFDVVKELKPSYPVYCLRPNILRETAQRFVEMFPGDVLYAVKCNPHPEVMRYLHEGGFDISTRHRQKKFRWCVASFRA